MGSKKATTVVVVPYRNRTKALTLLVRAKRHVCDDDKMMLTKLFKITISIIIIPDRIQFAIFRITIRLIQEVLKVLMLVRIVIFLIKNK